MFMISRRGGEQAGGDIRQGFIDRWARPIAIASAGALSVLSAFSLGEVPCPELASFSAAGYEDLSLETATNEGLLTVSTFNIQRGARGTDQVIEQIAAQPNGIIFLQEATTTTLAAITTQTKFKNIAPGWALYYPDEAYGNAVLTDLPILDSTTYRLDSFNDHEQRVAVFATILYQGKEVVAIGTHLINPEPGIFGSRRANEREAQIETIGSVARSERYRGKPKIAGGDFNAEDGSTAYEMMEHDFIDSAAVISGATDVDTFPLRGKRIDYIWLEEDSALRPVRYEVSGEDSSDHCKVTVVTEL